MEPFFAGCVLIYVQFEGGLRWFAKLVISREFGVGNIAVDVARRL
jgi:hypothetical protein